MKPLMRLLFLLTILLALSISAILFSIFQPKPLVNRVADLTMDSMEDGKRILDANDPRRLRAGEVRQVSLTQEDLDLAVNYLANQYARGSASLALQPGRAKVELTALAPRNPIGPYLNFEAELEQTSGLPRFQRLRIGSLLIPGWLVNWTLPRALRFLNSGQNYRVVADVVKNVSIGQGVLSVTYEWQGDLPGKFSGMLVPLEEHGRLLAYQQRLAEIRKNDPNGGPISLAKLMQPLFLLAAERSVQGDAIAENRCAIFVLTLYINRNSLSGIFVPPAEWPQALPLRTELNGRDDFAKHFIISAMMAAYAGSPLSYAVGLFKEVDDSRNGSGFSFNDIAADRAGTLFGEKAIASPNTARKIQHLVGSSERESGFMPSTDGLPEFMPEAEFKRRFGGIGGSAYNKMMQTIERRIEALAINK